MRSYFGFNLPKNYHSTSQALFRYEWRVFGWILPMAGIFLFAMIILVASKNGLDKKFIEVMVLMNVPLIVLPWFLPGEMSKSDLSASGGKSSAISSFIATLPVSNFDLAMAKLKLTVQSIGLYHLMILITINIILVLLDDKVSMNPWTLLESRFGMFEGGLILLGVNLMYPVITWALGGNTLAWCLKGQSFFIARRIVITFFSLPLIGFLIYVLYRNESFRDLLISYAPLINVLVFTLIATIFYRAIKKIQTVESLVAIKPVIIIASLLLVFEMFTLSNLGLITLDRPDGILVLLDLTFLGILPFLTSPFSVAMNRAR